MHYIQIKQKEKKNYDINVHRNNSSNATHSIHTLGPYNNTPIWRNSHTHIERLRWCVTTCVSNTTVIDDETAAAAAAVVVVISTMLNVVCTHEIDGVCVFMKWLPFEELRQEIRLKSGNLSAKSDNENECFFPFNELFIKSEPIFGFGEYGLKDDNSCRSLPLAVFFFITHTRL